MCLCCPLIQAKDPRIKVKTLSVHLIDLKKTDEGTFSISKSDSIHYVVINLKILGENIALYCTSESYIPSRNVCIGIYISYVQFSDRPSGFSLCSFSDCADKITLHYGGYYSFNIPRQAEYLEFTPHHSAEQSILWNRTNPRTNKESRVKIKWNTGKIDGIIPQDSGYYNLRKNDNTLLSRTLLTVKGD